MHVTDLVGFATRPCLISLEGRLSRAPGAFRLALRRIVRGLASWLLARPAAADEALRPAGSADLAAFEAYHAAAQAIAIRVKQGLHLCGAHVQRGHVSAVAPLRPDARTPAITASEAIAVILSEGVLQHWRERRVASQAIGDIVMTVQRMAQAARRDRPAHRVYVLIYESEGPDLVALNLEACRRPAEAVQEARERVQLIDALRRRFSAERVARAAMLGGEPSLILDSQLALEPRRRTLVSEAKAAA